ncbi:MAG: hypothetical protein ACE5HO_05655 [bacterium]
MFYKEAIQEFDPPGRDFLMLGLLSILEQISYTSKDGQFLRLVKKNIPPVKNVLRRQLTQMVADLRQQEQFLFKNEKASVKIFEGDARETCLPKEYWGKVTGVITSPPYLNRYDYSRTYSLELCTISVANFDELRDIRHKLLRSHIESKRHKGKEIHLPAIDEILSALAQKKLNISKNALEKIRKLGIPLHQVFCHPDILTSQNELIDYYRNVSALSQKGLSQILSGRGLTQKEKPLAISKIINGILSQVITHEKSFSKQSTDKVLFAELGTEIQGTWVNIIGAGAAKQVEQLMLEFVEQKK